MILLTSPGIEASTISGPLSLQDAVKTALESNPMVLASKDQVVAAQARIGMAKSMTRPQLSATATAGTANMEGFLLTSPGVTPTGITSFPGSTAATGQLMAMMPIYTGGKLSAQVNSAKALSQAASLDQASIQRSVTLETKLAYHQALLARETVQVFQDLVKEQTERVRVTEKSLNQGKIPKIDLLRNQTELADAQKELVDAEQSYQNALAELKDMLGVSQASDISLSDLLNYTSTQVASESLQKIAQTKRPELAAIHSRIESTQYNVQNTKGAYKPQVYLNGMGEIRSMRDGGESGYTIGVTASLPIFDGGQRRSAVQEAESMQKVMKQDERKIALSIEKEVQMALNEFNAADKKVALSKTAIEQAEEDYRVVKLRYEAGKAINTEVLDAFAALTQARTNQLQALTGYQIAKDRLSYAIGADLETLEVPT
jgi:outer membrane protein TolC